MPRAGGARKGTPGRSYSNRTDLNTNYAPQQGLTSAAAGGQTAAPGTAPAAPPAPVGGGTPASLTPDDTPNLLDPTARPDEPLTAGLPIGPGAGPEALATAGQKSKDAIALGRYLPTLRKVADRPDTPASFVALVRYLEGVQ